MTTALHRWVIVAVLFSGCTSQGTPLADSSASPSLSVASDSASVRGTVTSEELAPIAGARLTLPSLNLSATSGADGAYILAGVTPGTHRVVAEALGYQSVARDVNALAGEESRLDFALVALEVIVPYRATFPLAGYTECVVSLIFFTYYITNSFCPNQKHVLKVPVKEDWKYGILEQIWQGQTSMHFVSDTNNNCGYGNTSTDSCFFWRIGRSPMRLDAAPNDPKYVQWKMLYPETGFDWIITGLDAGYLQREIDGSPACDLAYQTYAGYSADCGGVGVGYPGYRFDLYAAVYYHEAPADPAKETAQPPK